MATQMISEVDFKAALADLNARVAKRDARIKELKARTAEDAEAAQAAAEQLAATNAAAVALKARIVKLEGRIARRDAKIAKKAAAVKSAVQQLAAKDAELAAKDEQIAALIARFAQFEAASAATVDSHHTVKQEPQEVERSRKKRPRQVSEDAAEHSDGVAEAAKVRVNAEPTAAGAAPHEAMQHLRHSNRIGQVESHDEHSDSSCSDDDCTCIPCVRAAADAVAAAPKKHKKKKRRTVSDDSTSTAMQKLNISSAIISDTDATAVAVVVITHSGVAPVTAPTVSALLNSATGARSLAEQYSMTASRLEHAKNYIEKLAANVTAYVQIVCLAMHKNCVHCVTRDPGTVPIERCQSQELHIRRYLEQQWYDNVNRECTCTATQQQQAQQQQQQQCGDVCRHLLLEIRAEFNP
eukprot:14009-Heterococcus_DN1.PRE.1